jgi:hypothetical protein
MSTLERAIAIAAEAHAGQLDKAGEPYILHPLRVMMRLHDNAERIVGVLHDVVENCPAWPLNRLAASGFAPDIMEALDAISRRKDEPYHDFIDRCCTTDLSLVVKFIDLRDYIDGRRADAIPHKLVWRYVKAIEQIHASDRAARIYQTRVLL